MMRPVVKGKCPLCHIDIFTRDGPTPLQCQFPVYQEKGGKTELGVCIPCFDTITDQEVQDIFDGIKVWWAENGFIATDTEIIRIARDEVWNKETSDGTYILVRP